MVGLLDIGCRAGAAALVDHVPGASFALSALRRHAQFKLDFVKAHASTCVAGNVAVRDAAADADNHGDTIMDKGPMGGMRDQQKTLLAKNGKQLTYRCQIINANLSH